MKKNRLFIILLYIIVFSNMMFLGIITEAEEQPRYGGTFVCCFGGEPKTIRLFQPDNYVLLNQISGRLLKIGPGYGVYPDLAESYEVEDGGKTYIFHLRDDVSWHDGIKFTAADVEFHYLTANVTTSRLYGYLQQAGFYYIDTPDPYTVVMKFEKAVLPWIFARVHSDGIILPKHLYEGTDLDTNPYNEKPIGNGRYKFVDWVRGSHIILEANEEYWGGRPYLDRIIYRFIDDANTALRALEAGEIDHVGSYLGSDVWADLPRLDADPNFEIYPRSYYTQARIIINFQERATSIYPWLNDVNVRRALEAACDKDAINLAATGGYSEISDGPYINSVWWYDPDAVYSMEYDPTLAEQLLDEAGYPRGTDGVRFTFEAPASDQYVPLAELTAQFWDEIGVKCNWKIVSHSAFYSDYYAHPEGLRDYPMGIFRGGVGPDPDAAIQLYDVTTAEGGLNFGYYYNESVSEALRMGGTLFDQEERAPYYAIAQEGITRDVACIYFYDTWQCEIWNVEFQGVRESMDPAAHHGRWDYVYWTLGELPEPEPEPEPPIIIPDTGELEEKVEALENAYNALSSQFSEEISSLRAELSNLEDQLADIDIPTPNMTMSYVAIVIALLAVGVSVYFGTKAK